MTSNGTLISLRRRLALGVLSQGIASAANLVASLVGARYLSGAAFGAFATAYVVYLVVLGATRAIIGEPLLVGADRPGAPEGAARSASAAGLVSAIIIAGAAAATSGHLRGSLAGLALIIWPLVIMDNARYLAFGENQPQRAVWVDVTWTISMCIALAMLVALDWANTGTMVLAWGVGAVPSAILVRGRGGLPAPSFAWTRTTWMLSWRYAAEWFIGTGLVQLTLLLLTPIAGLAAVGTVRGTQVLYGPLNVLFGGALAVLVPTGHRLDADRLRGLLARTSGGLVLGAIGLTLMFMVLPSSVGEAALGATWPNVRAQLLPAGLAAMAGGLMAGAIAGLRSRRAAETSLSVRLQAAPVLLVLPLMGAVWGGAGGYLWGSAVGAGLAAVLWWRAFLAIPSAGIESLEL